MDIRFIEDTYNYPWGGLARILTVRCTCPCGREYGSWADMTARLAKCCTILEERAIIECIKQKRAEELTTWIKRTHTCDLPGT